MPPLKPTGIIHVGVMRFIYFSYLPIVQGTLSQGNSARSSPNTQRPLWLQPGYELPKAQTDYLIHVLQSGGDYTVNIY